jgi:hypothetical protein
MGQLETGIRDALLAQAGITNLVGRRIRPLVVGQGDSPRPYLTYQVTGRTTEALLDGTVIDYRKAEWEIGIYADTYGAVMDLSDLVRDRLDQLGETVSGVEFAPAQFDSETDVEQVTPDGQEKPVYLRVQTYRALYKIVS